MKKSKLLVCALGVLALSSMTVVAAPVEEEEQVHCEEITENTSEENTQDDIEQHAQKYSGFQKIDGYLFYFDPKTGEKLLGLQTIEGKTYYFYPGSGAALSGLQIIDGKKYYFDTTTYAMKTGLLKITQSGKKNLYYFLPEGGAASGFKVVNGDTYYFYPSTNVALGGLQKINGKMYYFNSDTMKMQTGILEIDYNGKKQKHYFLPEGGLASGWITDNGKKYYFSSDDTGNVMLFGAQIINGKEYYFDVQTGEQVEGVYKNNQGKAYYYTLEGGVKYGIQEWNGNIYFLKESKSGEVQYGLQSEGKALYFFDYTTGAAWRNTSVKIAHIVFDIGSDGVVTNCKAEAGYENNIRTKILLNGLKLLGEPYSLDADKGYACGYFVSCLYKSVGIESIKGSSDQQAKAIVEDGVGKRITEAELKPGDLVYWRWDSCGEKPACTHWMRIHHTGVYLGNGKMLEASEPRGGVVVQDIHSFDQFQIEYYVDVIQDAEGGYESDTNTIEIPYSVKAVAVDTQSAKITWQATGDLDGYVVHRMGPGETKFSYRTMFTNRDTKSFIDKNLKEDSIYYYRIYGFKYDSEGKIVFSGSGGSKNYVWVKLPKDVAPVSGLEAASAGRDKIKLTWNKVSGAEGYIIYRKVGNEDFKYRYMVSGTSFVDTTPMAGEYNYYRVYAYVTKDGVKKLSASTSYVYAKGVCPAVTNLKASSVSNGVKLTWTSSAGAEGYLIYGIRGDNGKYGYIGMTTKGTTFTDTKAYKTQYNFYWVFPYHKDSNGKMIVGETPKYVYGRAK